MVKSEICIPYYESREISQNFNEKWLNVRFVFHDQLTENVEKMVKCEIYIPLYKPSINSQLTKNG